MKNILKNALVLVAVTLSMASYSQASCKVKKTIMLSDDVQTASEFYNLLQFHELMPDYFGRNKDALFEVLTDNAHTPFNLLCQNNKPLTAEVQEVVDVMIEAQSEGACVQVQCY